MSADAGSTLTVTLPAGTNTATWEGATVRDVTTAADVGFCNNPSSGLTITCAFFSNGVVNALDQLQITLRGITNGTAGAKTLTVATTSDLPAVTSDPYDVVANHAGERRQRSHRHRGAVRGRAVHHLDHGRPVRRRGEQLHAHLPGGHDVPQLPDGQRLRPRPREPGRLLRHPDGHRGHVRVLLRRSSPPPATRCGSRSRRRSTPPPARRSPSPARRTRRRRARSQRATRCPRTRR